MTRWRKRTFPWWFVPIAVLMRLIFWAYVAATIWLVVTGGFEGWW